MAEPETTEETAHTEPPSPKVVMSIHAHPDDQEFSVGGTLAKWAKAGAQIITLCLTQGDAGTNPRVPPPESREALARLRMEEQVKACEVLGIFEAVFFDYPDGMLEHTIDLRRDVTRQIRKYRPDVVVCSDPTVRFYGDMYMNHPDHRAAADAAIDAVFPSAGTQFIFPELLEEDLPPHEVREVYIHGSENPNTFIDISEVIETKVAALLEHRSQLGDWNPVEMVREWAAREGQPRGLPAAEAFRRMVLVRDES